MSLPEEGESGHASSAYSPDDAPDTSFFEGKFLPAGGSGRHGDLLGRGSISLTQNTVMLRGKTHRHFWFGQNVCHAIAREHLFNASRHDAVVTFELEIPLGRQTGIHFQTDSTAHAAALLQALPNRSTPEFVQDLTERHAFAEHLARCSPRAWITPLLVGLNVLVFVLMAISGVGFLESDGQLALDWGTNFSPLTLDGQWWRLLTSLFIHFGIMHLSFNMLALYSVGNLVERLYGSAHFLVIYLVAGLAGSLGSLIWHPVVNSAGASGAIFGIFGAMLVYVLNPSHGVPRSLMQAHRKSIGACIAYNLIFGATMPGIDNAAHVSGLLGGMLMGLILARPVTSERRFSLSDLVRCTTVGVVMLALETSWLFLRDH